MLELEVKPWRNRDCASFVHHVGSVQQAHVMLAMRPQVRVGPKVEVQVGTVAYAFVGNSEPVVGEVDGVTVTGWVGVCRCKFGAGSHPARRRQQTTVSWVVRDWDAYVDTPSDTHGWWVDWRYMETFRVST